MLPLEVLVAPQLKAAGFTKKSRTWWRDAGETVQVLNLQKSSFGERLYVNLGVYIKPLGTEHRPPHNRCHLQARLERVATPSRAAAVLRAESAQQPDSALVEAITLDGVAWLDRLSSKDGIRNYINSGGAKIGMVFGTVHQFISTPE